YNLITYYIILVHLNTMSLFIHIVSDQNTANITLKSAFFHILVNVYRLYTESNTVYKIRTTFTILSCKRTIDSQIESCNRYIVLTDSKFRVTCQATDQYNTVYHAINSMSLFD